jgi:hypothetical protein
MMVTVFLWTNNINVPCKPPTHIFEGKVRQKKWGQYTSKYGRFEFYITAVCKFVVTSLLLISASENIYHAKSNFQLSNHHPCTASPFQGFLAGNNGATVQNTSVGATWVSQVLRESAAALHFPHSALSCTSVCYWYNCCY